MEKTKKNWKGFSLIELLLVMAIISITSTVILTDWTGGRTTQQLGNAAREVEAVVREAQNYALTGTQGMPDTEPCGFQVSWGGSAYGITYKYRDNNSGDCSQELADFRSYTLRDGVTFNDSGNFSFSLPHAGVSFSDSSQAIVLTKVSINQVVCVYKAGLINNTTGPSCP